MALAEDAAVSRIRPLLRFDFLISQDIRPQFREVAGREPRHPPLKRVPTVAVYRRVSAQMIVTTAINPAISRPQIHRWSNFAFVVA